MIKLGGCIFYEKQNTLVKIKFQRNSNIYIYNIIYYKSDEWISYKNKTKQSKHIVKGDIRASVSAV